MTTLRSPSQELLALSNKMQLVESENNRMMDMLKQLTNSDDIIQNLKDADNLIIDIAIKRKQAGVHNVNKT